MRVDELGEEGEEEHGDFGVQDVVDGALNEDLAEAGGLNGGGCVGTRPGKQDARAEIHEIASAEIAERLVSDGHGAQELGEPERDGEDVEEAARSDAERGNDSRRSSLPGTARDNIKHVRPRSNVNQKHGCYEEEHCFSLENSVKPKMPVSEKKVLAVMTDLFFSAKIIDIARKLGMSVEFVKDRDVVLEKVKAKPAVVIFDLNYEALDPVAVIKAIKADATTKRVSTIGFVSHVQTELKLRAQDAGCDMVVARSVFATNLPMILKRHATIEVANRS